MSVAVGRGFGSQPRDQDQDTLEALLFKATNPSNKVEDVNTIKLFCDQIEKIPDGAIIAGRLLSHRIQSPQEQEALQALAVVEAAARSSPAFVVEAGKFRFLNEMIKLISPKYLATRTPDSVKLRVTELLYTWTKQYPQEKKICEAYEMLKGQGIIKEDPVYINEAVCSASLKPREPDLSEEESKRLQRLLHSGNPQDLEKANNIIQGMVKKEEQKLEKATRQACQLQEVQSSSRLLADMLEQVGRGGAAEGDREIMADLYQACERWRPTLFRLAAEAEENDPAIGDILYASDELSRVMDKYKDIIILNKIQRPASNVLDFHDLSTQPRKPVDPFEQFLLSENAESAVAAARIEALNIRQNGGSGSILDSLSDKSSILGPDDSTSLSGGEEQSNQRMQQGIEYIRSQDHRNLLLEDDIRDFTAELLSEFVQNDSLTVSVESDITPPVQPEYRPPVQDLLTDEPLALVGPDCTSLLLANLSMNSDPRNTNGRQKEAGQQRGLAELDQLGEAALMSQLPRNREAAFVARKLEKLPLKELMRQRSSTAEFQDPPKRAPPTGATEFQDAPKRAPPTGATESRVLNPSDFSGSEATTLIQSRSPPDEPRTLDHVRQSGPGAGEVKLSEISLRLEDVTPHHSLRPTSLLEAEGGVTAVLHPTSNSPRPGVAVFVLQLTNASALQVEDLDFKAAVPRGCKVRVCKLCRPTLPPPSPFSPPPSVNQLLMLYSPDSSDVLLSFVLSYTIEEEPFTHIGKDILLPCSST